MKYKVLKEGRTPLNSHVKKVVAKGLTWREAYDKVWLLHDLYGGSWDIWFTPE